MNNFIVALSRMDYGVDPYEFGTGESQLEMFVRTYEEWTALKAVRSLPELAERFTEQFFTETALMVFVFSTPTRGGRIDNIKVNISGNKVSVEIDGELGYMDAMSYGIVVIEINKTNIQRVNSLKFTTSW